eukprot:gene8507-biopygen5843
MFPWSDHVLRELNTKMLDAVASVGSLEGGEYPLTEAERLKKMFAREESVLRIGAPGSLEGGADPLPVRDANGQPVNFYVDVQEIENACNAICEAYKKNDDRLYSYIQKLEAKVDDLKKRRPAQQKVQHIHHYEAPYDEYGQPRRGRGGQRWRGGRGGTYRGGSSNMDEEYPKRVSPAAAAAGTPCVTHYLKRRVSPRPLCGDLTQGKTSDAELDFVYQRYLPLGVCYGATHFHGSTME